MPSQFGGVPANPGAQDVLSVYDAPEYQGEKTSKFGGVSVTPPGKSKFGGVPAQAPAGTSKFGGAPAAPQDSKAGSFLGDLAESVKNRFFSKPLADTGRYVRKNFTEGVDTALFPEPVTYSTASKQTGPAHERRAAENLELAKRLNNGVAPPPRPAVETSEVLTQLQRPLGVAQAITAPLNAITHGFISEPVEEATSGKIKADWVDLTRMFTPAAVGAAAGVMTRMKEAAIPPAAEKITGAAVKVGDRVVTGANHDEARAAAGVKQTAAKDEGFQTNKGRFLSREEALKLANQNGQVPAAHKLLKPGMLHSEDMATAQGLPAEKGIPQKDPNLLQKAAKEIESIFSPTTKSAEAKETEGIVREARGLAERDTLQAQHQIDGMAKEINALAPEDQRDFVHYVETRSAGGKLKDPKLQKAADTIRDIYQKVRAKLENSPHTQGMGFIQDYFVHQWKDPKKAQAFAAEWVSKYGSGKSTKARSIPTIEDGIKAGLVPLRENPLDATMAYIASMHNYIAMNDIHAAMKEQKLRKFFPEGRQPAGWMELKGPGNRVQYTMKDKKTGSLRASTNVAYAPEDAARIYNRYYDKGVAGSNLYKLMRNAVNAPTQILLALAAFHYRLIANEVSASAFAEGLGRAAEGDIGGAAESAIKGIPYAGAVRQGFRGERIEHQFLGGQGGMDEKIIDYMTRAGGRLSGVDVTMKNTESGDFWDAWKKGTAKTQLKAMGGSVGAFAKGIGQMIDTVNAPLFKKTIPWIKNSVNYDGIAEWVRAHPGASEKEILSAARDIIDSTDNRFGEMIQDNLFWPKALKQAAQLMVLSVGWDLGTAREVGGGMKDLSRYVSGKGELTPRAKYIIGAPIAHMLNAATYQYLKTGKGPQVPQDLVYPQTGGEVTESPGTKYEKKVPERLNLPSQMKDVINMQEDPLGELKNKLAPVWRIAYQMGSNSDWRADPISYRIMQNAPSGIKAYAEYVMQALTPISLQNRDVRKAGSNISALEHLAGSSPTGMRGRDPEGYRAMQDTLEKEREEKGFKHYQQDRGITPEKKPRMTKTGRPY